MHTTPPGLFPSTRPRVYWLDNVHEPRARVRMYNRLAHSKVKHVAVPAFDAYRDFAGNVLRASTLSHVRALRRIHKDSPAGQIAYVAENTLSFEYVPHWTTTLERILCNAPEGWGIIQLAYVCSPATASIVRNTPSVRGPLCVDDPFVVEKAVVQSPQAPFVPWKGICTYGTAFYAVHPRGYKAILQHVKRYKYDPLYCNERIPRFHPDIDPSHLFALAKTFTFNIPLFTTVAIPRTIAFKHTHTKWYTSHKERMDILVRAWRDAYVKWDAQRETDEQVRQNYLQDGVILKYLYVH